MPHGSTLEFSNSYFLLRGYGVIVKNILPSLKNYHPSCFITNYGLQGGQRIDNYWEGITFYGQGHGGFEESLVPNHVKDFGADCLITIYDIWALPKLHIELANNQIPLIPYFPVDKEEANPKTKEVLAHAFKIIPMSQHSEDCLKKIYPEKTLPHIFPGVNTSIFKPLWTTKEEKDDLKKQFGFEPDTFLIYLMGDIKGHRKRWSENLEGIKKFKEQNPDIKVRILIHTNLRLISGADFNIEQVLNELGIQEITRGTDPYQYTKGVTEEELNKMYNAADVFLQASQGEGAGMSFLEASAASTPSIATDFTSMPQAVLHEKTGFLTKPHCLSYDLSMARIANPDPGDIAVKLKMVYDRGSTSFRAECLKHAKNYEWSKIIKEKWLPTLALLEKEIEKAHFKPIEPSQKLKERAEKVFVV